MSHLHVEGSDGKGSWLDSLGQKETAKIVIIVAPPVDRDSKKM